MVTQVGRNMFLEISHAPIPRGRAKRPKNFGTPTYAKTILHTATKFGVGACFYGVSHYLVGAKRHKNFGTSCMRAHCVRNNDEILHIVIKPDVTKAFANADARSVCCS